MLSNVILILSVIFGVIILVLTKILFNKTKSTIIRIMPMLAALFGLLFFGIGPQIFNYVHGITLGLVFLIVGILFGITLACSLIMFIFFSYKEKKNINQ